MYQSHRILAAERVVKNKGGRYCDMAYILTTLDYDGTQLSLASLQGRLIEYQLRLG